MKTLALRIGLCIQSLEALLFMWRQRGRVVRASDLKSEGRGFKSRSDR